MLKIWKKGDFVYVAFIIVCAFQYKKGGIHVPLIRVMKNDEKFQLIHFLLIIVEEYITIGKIF